jgi:hypothetical protein
MCSNISIDIIRSNLPNRELSFPLKTGDPLLRRFRELERVDISGDDLGTRLRRTPAIHEPTAYCQVLQPFLGRDPVYMRFLGLGVGQSGNSSIWVFLWKGP